MFEQGPYLSCSLFYLQDLAQCQHWVEWMNKWIIPCSLSFLLCHLDIYVCMKTDDFIYLSITSRNSCLYINVNIQISMSSDFFHFVNFESSYLGSWHVDTYIKALRSYSHCNISWFQHFREVWKKERLSTTKISFSVTRLPPLQNIETLQQKIVITI